MKWSTMWGVAAPFTRQELYELWCNFKHDPNADRMLSDFMNSDRQTAATLIAEFERRYSREQEERKAIFENKGE